MRVLPTIASGLLVAGMILCVRPAMADEADRLFSEGAAAFEAGKAPEALKSFQAAWELRKSYDLASAMAQAELAMGMNRDAAEHLSYALRNFAVTAKPEKRALLEKAFADVRTKLATLHITANVDGAEVRVNGASIGKTPLEPEVFADAGTVTVEVEADGHENARRSLDAKTGETQDVTLTLPPKARSMVPAIVLGGGAVVAASVGVGLLVASGDRRGEAERMRDNLVATYGSKPCGQAAAADQCKATEATIRERVNLGNLGVGVLGGAGALAGGAVVYWLVARRTPAAARVGVLPVLGEHAGGLIVHGSF